MGHVMTEYIWSDLREHAIERFNGQTPSAELEEAIIVIFQARPAQVVSEIERVAGKLAAGEIRSPWPILRLNLNEGAKRDVRATDTLERDRAVERAEKWIRAVGIGFDRGTRDPEHPELESELEQELFGDRGMLRDWAGDELLRARLLLLWTMERPRGEQVEREAEQRGAAWVAAKAEAAKRARAKSEGATSEEALA